MARIVLLGSVSIAVLAFVGCGDDEESGGGGTSAGTGGGENVVMVPEGTGGGMSTTIVCEDDGSTYIIRPDQRHCFDPRTVNDPPPPLPETGDGGAGGAAVGGAGGVGGDSGDPVVPEGPELPPFTGECPSSADVAGACFTPLCASEAPTTQDNPDMPCCYVGTLVDDCTGE